MTDFIKIRITSVVGDKITFVTEDEQQMTRKLSKKLYDSGQLPNVDAIYSVLMNDNFINYLKYVGDEDESPKPKAKPSNPPKPQAGNWQNKKHPDEQDVILAQSTLERAVEIVGMSKSTSEEVNWKSVQEMHKQIYKYMKNKQYEN